MFVKKIEISAIRYQTKNYDDVLLKSLQTKGNLISIKVTAYEDYYECIDGHKRLSCIIAESLEIKEISAVIINDYSKQGSSFWGSRNQH